MIEEYEKAREEIAEGLNYVGRRNGRDFTRFEKTLMVAVVAIEKQIPKKEHRRNRWWGEERFCPNCGAKMDENK